MRQVILAPKLRWAATNGRATVLGASDSDRSGSGPAAWGDPDQVAVGVLVSWPTSKRRSLRESRGGSLTSLMKACTRIWE